MIELDRVIYSFAIGFIKFVFEVAMSLCNRFELLSVARQTPGAKVWAANDLLVKLPVQVFEWKPDDAGVEAARLGFDACVDQVKAVTVDAFALPPDLYYFVAHKDTQAREAIRILQSHGLFVCDLFKPGETPLVGAVKPDSPQPDSTALVPEARGKRNTSAIYFRLVVGAIVFVLSGFLITKLLTNSQQSSDHTAEALRIGLYSWPGMFPGWWAAQRHKDKFDVKIEETVPDLLQKDYEVIAVPLTALPAMLRNEGWKDAKVTRVLARSNGSEHLFKRSDVDDAQIYANGAKIECPPDSFSESLLKSYLAHVPARPSPGDSPYTREPPTTILKNADNPQYSVLALPDPFAAQVPRGFTDVKLAGYADLEKSYLIVLVARQETLKSNKNSVLNFIKEWTVQGDTKSRELGNMSGNDIRRVAAGFAPYKGANERVVHAMVRSGQPVGNEGNIEFFYGCPIHGCKRILKSLGEDDFLDSDVCGEGLAELWPAETLAEKRNLRRSMEALIKNRPDEACSLERTFGPPITIEGFGLDNTDVDKLGVEEKKKIPANLNSDHYYCVVGYGDKVGKDEPNGTIGKGRAESVAAKLKGLVPSGHLATLADKSDRRGQLVEIREYSPPLPQ